MNFSERKLEILHAIINDYIETAIPVGSRTIARKYMPNISSATIRNEMSDLEHMGLLEQPHTSAGRIPSQRAYRMYVDRLIDSKTINEVENQRVRDYFLNRAGEMQQMVRNAAKAISQMTNYTAIALTPQLRRTTLKRIQLIPVTKGLALVVIVTDAARVKQKMMHIPGDMDENLLDNLSVVLSARFSGLAIADIDINLTEGIQDVKIKYAAFFRDLSQYLSDIVVKSDGSDVIMEGSMCIFDYPEYRDMERAKRFIQLLENKDLLTKLLSDSTRRGTSVVIGSENALDELRDFSVVTTAYKVNNRPIGAIGIIGPVRMDYGRVINVLKQVGNALSDVMTTYINE